MINLKREDIKTMERDIANLQGGGKALKEKSASYGLFVKSKLDEDLESRINAVFSAMEKKTEQPSDDTLVFVTPVSQKSKETKAPPIPGIKLQTPTKPEENPASFVTEPKSKIIGAPDYLPFGSEKEVESDVKKFQEELKNINNIEEEEEKKKREEEEEAERLKEEEEEKKKREEEEEAERLARKKKIILPVLLDEAKERIKAQKAKLQKRLAEISKNNQPLEDKRVGLIAQTEQIKSSELALMIDKERQIEARKQDLERNRRGRTLSAIQEKIINEKLWEVEDKRKQIEKRRWEIEDQITRREVEIKKIELELAERNKENEAIEKDLTALDTQLKLIDFVNTKKTLGSEIEEIRAEKDKLSSDFEKAAQERLSFDETLNELKESEKAIEEELKMIEEKEQQALTPDEKREIEKTRWKVEDEKRKTTKDRWEYEAKKAKAESAEQEKRLALEGIDKKLKAFEDKLSADEIVLEKEGINIQRLRDETANLLKENGFDPEELEALEEIEQSTEPENTYEDRTETEREEGETEREEGETEREEGETEIIQEEKIAEEKLEEKPEPLKPDKEEPPIPQEPLLQEEDSGWKKTSPQKPEEKTISSPPAGKTETKEIPLSASSFRETIEYPSPAQSDQAFGNSFKPSVPPIAAANQPKPSAPISSPSDDQAAETSPFLNRWNMGQNPPASPNPQDQALPKVPGGIDFEEEAPQKPGSGKKLLIRLFIIIIFVAAVGLVFAFVFKKKEPIPEGNDQNNEITEGENQKEENQKEQNKNEEEENEEENEEEENEEENEEEEKIEPASLISTISTVPIVTENLNDIETVLSPYLQSGFQGSGFYRILIENKKENKYIGLKDFFEAFEIKAPDGLLERLEDNFTLFIYSDSSKNQHRLGFVAKIAQKEGLAEIAKEWEKTIENDTDKLYKILGKKNPASPAFFKTAPAKNGGFRYLDFPDIPNFGICYVVYNEEYFIFTSSGDSLKKTITQLENK